MHDGTESTSAKVTLPILELSANVKGAGRHVRTFGAMDIYSNYTFFTRNLANRLGINGSKKKTQEHIYI